MQVAPTATPVTEIPDDGEGATTIKPLVAALIASVCVLCCAVAVPLTWWLEGRADVEPVHWGDLVLGSVWPVAGALVVRAAPRNPVGWVLLSAGLIGPYHLAGRYAAAASEPGSSLPVIDLVSWLSVWGFVPYFWVLPLVLLLFPDGRPLSRRWRPVVIGLVVTATLTSIARMVSPVTSDLASTVFNPWHLGWDGLRWVTLFGSLSCIFGGMALGVATLILRTRRSAGRSRTQMQWLLLGGVILLVGFSLPFPDDDVREVTLAIGLLGPPLGITIAIVRHGLFDVAIALNRTIVLVLLSTVVVAIYALAVLAIGSVGATSGPGLLLVAGAALVAASGRRVVQAAVDRWLFGHRHDPYAVVTRVGRHLAPAAEPQEALNLLVEALQRALRLPYVAFTDPESGLLVTAGEPVPDLETVPATALGHDVGELHVGRRRPGERFGAEERDAIAEVAARAGTLAYAHRLVSDVADSRARIVVAREEERRRLRDDLHDELGPTLAGTAHQLESLATRFRRAGDAVGAERADALRDRMRTTIGDVRRIVHGLRPPVLDQLGLGAALESLVDGIDTPRCHRSIALPRQLPAAVEVAAYTIAAEAVSNSLRHSAGSTLWISAQLVEDDAWLRLEIRDNGQGIHARDTRGLGLRSMSERALEVGGALDVGHAATGGTEIIARLPLGTS